MNLSPFLRYKSITWQILCYFAQQSLGCNRKHFQQEIVMAKKKDKKKDDKKKKCDKKKCKKKDVKKGKKK
jgi:hypothetical protein